MTPPATESGPSSSTLGCSSWGGWGWENMGRCDSAWGPQQKQQLPEGLSKEHVGGAEGWRGPGLELSEWESGTGDAPHSTHRTVAKCALAWEKRHSGTTHLMTPFTAPWAPAWKPNPASFKVLQDLVPLSTSLSCYISSQLCSSHVGPFELPESSIPFFSVNLCPLLSRPATFPIQLVQL
ncbi:hypothetical protein HJG60_011372 [Phyllostomus discolor]|uniref:Uncharacterized protein n=1 Tax=Phyllostomus discolor TaxID=89673 RepID=A0A833ZWR0_9CHIR|nr:hypothetical protein HJG60_011372 [Phyllostomus discolor]